MSFYVTKIGRRKSEVLYEIEKCGCEFNDVFWWLHLSTELSAASYRGLIPHPAGAKSIRANIPDIIRLETIQFMALNLEQFKLGATQN